MLPLSGVFSKHDAPGRHVIGTPSHGLLARVIFGNVVHVLMQHASCPVLTVAYRPRDEPSHDDSA